jgi:hypothetical protein
MDMTFPDLASLGALSLPAAATLIGFGWQLCSRILVKPLEARLSDAERRIQEHESREHDRLKKLEAKVGY